MKKILISALFTILLTANQEILEDLNTTIEDTNITQIKDSNLTEDELIANILKMHIEIKEEKVKTKNLKKLRKTVDDLSQHLGIDE